MSGKRTLLFVNVAGQLLVMGLFVLAPSSNLTAASVVVIDPNRPLPSVVTTDKQADKDAAADFCHYLSLVSGREIAPLAAPRNAGVIIHVGADAFVKEKAPEINSLFADGYIVKYVAAGGRDHIVLAGKIRPSSQWAIEQFLKDCCGVRWLFPDPVYGEIVPSKPSITVENTLFRKYEPNYLSRSNCGMYYFTPARTELRLRAFGYGYGEHAIQRIFSGKEFKAHPEWFAYFKGKRQWWTYGNGWQICTTNEGTVRHAIEYCLDYFRKNPETPMVSIGANDGWGECECPECTKFLSSVHPPYTVSERWWHWVNRVAKEVGKTYPTKWVESLAYSQTSDPPRFPLEPNVAITKTIVLDSELQQAEAWGKVCKSVNLYSYMYGGSFLGFRHYPHAAKDFLKWGHEKLGALAHITECNGDWTFDGPKYQYLQALQWDVNTDVDQIMEDFCQNSYGKAADVMRAFWDRHERVYENRKSTPYGRTGTRLLFYQWVSWQNAPYLVPNQEFNCYTLDDVNYLDQCIAEAARLAASDGKEVRYRVERMSEAWKLVRTMLLSRLRYYDHPLVVKIDSEQMKQSVLAQIRELAQLRADRRLLLGTMRMYPIVNPRMVVSYYWSYGSGLTLFSHESALLDESCTALTEYLRQTQGITAALQFWQEISESDSLFESAQTQLYLLGKPNVTNVLVNGDFEMGTLKGWEITSGQADVAADKGHGGKFVVRMPGSEDTVSQNVPVSPGQRYQFTAWARYLTAPKGDAIPLEATLQFYSGPNGINYSEPTRCMLRTRDVSAGWVMLRSTVTVPLEADRVAINLIKTFSGTVLWDNVTFVKIKPGPEVAPGQLRETFSEKNLSGARWCQCSGSGGILAPRTADGWLVYDDEKMFPVVSFATFNDLLKYKGRDRYRLRLHATSLSAEKPASFCWAVKSGTSPINISDSGMYWTHQFGSSQNPKVTLATNCYQNSVRTGGDVNTLNLKLPGAEVWYSLYFDPEYVTVYAATESYDETEKSLVTKIKHGITNLAANGKIYLKLDRGFYRLDEITLSSPAKRHVQETPENKTGDEDKARQLMMPGVTQPK